MRETYFRRLAEIKGTFGAGGGIRSAERHSSLYIVISIRHNVVEKKKNRDKYSNKKEAHMDYYRIRLSSGGKQSYNKITHILFSSVDRSVAQIHFVSCS